jgi:hypothetical protein
MLTSTLDLKTFCDQLSQTLKADLEALAQGNPDVAAMASKALIVVRMTVLQLKEFVYDYEFQSKGEEIEFFKETKPRLVSQYYYYDKVLSLKINEPVTDPSSLKDYCFQELSRLQEFVRNHQEFFTYYLSGSTQLDEHYFVRESTTFKGIDIDSRFSTGYDNVLAIIHANQMIRGYLQSLLDQPNSNHLDQGMVWTGSKTALIELIYALHGAQVINNGKADIKKIAATFERLFNISIGDLYRQFFEIKLRKRDRTSFIDHLKKELEHKLDELGE